MFDITKAVIFLPFLKATCTFSFGKICTFWNKLGKSRNKISLKKHSNYWFRTSIFCSQMPLSYQYYYQESERVRKIYKGTSLFAQGSFELSVIILVHMYFDVFFYGALLSVNNLIFKTKNIFLPNFLEH